MKTNRNHRIVVASALHRPGRVRLALAGLLLLGLASSAPPVWAQVPQSDPGPQKSFMAKNLVYMPIIVDEKARAGLREILLYVKEGPQAPWLLTQKAPPTQTGFQHLLPHDGEYWFNVVTIDQSGRATPPDVAAELPAVVVVLDTAAPQVELKPMAGCAACAEGVCIKCEVHDANPNPFQTRFEYQTADHVWRSLDPMQNQLDCFCIPKQAMLTGMVKVTCADRAMNTTVREFSLASLGTSNVPANIAQAPAKTVTPVASFEQSPTVATRQFSSPMPTGSSTIQQVKSAPVAAIKPKELHLECNDKPCSDNKPAMVAAAPGPVLQSDFNLAKESKRPGANWIIVNKPRVSLGYKIEDEGQSGIGKVEVWITKDNGQSWDVLCDDPDKTSPADFDLPGEGVYGLCLVVTNGRGFGANPPKPGDAPEYAVELDMTKPHAELGPVKLGPPDDSASVDIAWEASDKNLDATPIDIYYSGTPQGPWTPITKGLANTGKYRWYLPQEICRQVYIRLAVTDMANNCTRCETSEPLTLEEPNSARPKAIIVNIVPASSIMTPHN